MGEQGSGHDLGLTSHVFHPLVPTIDREERVTSAATTEKGMVL